MSALVTGFVGAVAEAWAQLRIGKMRVLLSLVGVAVAVAAMTFAIAFVQVSEQVVGSQLERWAGRPGTVTISISPTGRGLGQGDKQDSEDQDQGASSTALDPGAAGGERSPQDARKAAKITQAQAEFVERYQVRSWTTVSDTSLRLNLGERFATVSTQAVSLGYGTMHHTQVAQGRWFQSSDTDDLSPSLVVSQGVLDQMGVQSLTGPLTVRSFSPAPVTFTIVGVLEPADLTGCLRAGADGEVPCDQPLEAYVLADSLAPHLPATAALPAPRLKVWAGNDASGQLSLLATRHFDAVFGKGSTSTEVNGIDSQQDTYFARVFTIAATGAGLFVMTLGALGLVNISLVTVRQRIHEIGVRRSFGATSRRIFLSIMLESVVATVVAGVVGIIIAIIAMRVVPLDVIFQLKVTNRPPFPLGAALIGLASATLVGALAGLLPALVAVRIRPIDAIRY